MTAGVIAAATFSAACSDVGNDAARVGDVELGSEEFTAWLDDVSIARPDYLLSGGVIDAEGARELLTRWISARVIERVVADEGGEVTDDDRAAALSALENSGEYAGVSDESLARLADFDAAAAALSRVVGIDDEAAAELYASGVDASGAVCVRAIIGETVEAVERALRRVANGRDFVDVADTVNPPGALGPGGAVVDRDGSECIPAGAFASGVTPETAAAVGAAQIGEPTPVVDIGGGYATLLVRPYDEVAESARTTMATAAARTAGRSALQGSDDIAVASRYGRWDGERMAVVAIG
jgi:hypothetical protein